MTTSERDPALYSLPYAEPKLLVVLDAYSYGLSDEVLERVRNLPIIETFRFYGKLRAICKDKGVPKSQRKKFAEFLVDRWNQADFNNAACYFPLALDRLLTENHLNYGKLKSKFSTAKEIAEKFLDKNNTPTSHRTVCRRSGVIDPSGMTDLLANEVDNLGLLKLFKYCGSFQLKQIIRT